MTLEEIRSKASSMGLKGVNAMRKGELIRTIQRAEGYTPCFGGAQRGSCVETDCCWRFDCLRKVNLHLPAAPSRYLPA